MFPTLIVVFGILSAVGADMAAFCENQEEVYQDSAVSIQRMLMSLGRATPDDMEPLCKALVDFSNTAYDTQVTCAENSDAASTHMWRNINDLIANVCPNQSLLMECSSVVVGRLVGHCASIIGSVQIDSPMEKLCQAGQEYLACLGNITSLCAGSTALIDGNVNAAMANARSSLRSICPSEADEEMQGDAPGGPAAPASPECNVNMVNQVMGRCNRDLVVATQATNADYCRAYHDFLACADRVRENCPTMRFPDDLEVVRATYHTQCRGSYYTCLPEILDGSTTVQAHCLNSEGNIEMNSSAYCRKMRSLSHCLERLRDVCPFARDSDRHELDVVSSGVDEGLHRYC